MESVSFGGGRTTFRTTRSTGSADSRTRVELDGSSLIDVGSNSGVIVTLNNDMVQEVKVESSNFAAEYGTGGMNVSAVTKGGSSRFSGTLYDYNRELTSSRRTTGPTASPARRSRRASSTIRAATSAARSSSRASHGTRTATRRSSSRVSRFSASRSTRARFSAPR